MISMGSTDIGLTVKSLRKTRIFSVVAKTDIYFRGIVTFNKEEMDETDYMISNNEEWKIWIYKIEL